jgi:hypothetical protein
MVEDVNEAVSPIPESAPDQQHVEAWAEMLSKSDPPIESTVISPYLGEHAFRSGRYGRNAALTVRTGNLLGRVQGEEASRVRACVPENRGGGAAEDCRGAAE